MGGWGGGEEGISITGERREMPWGEGRRVATLVTSERGGGW